MSERFCLIVTPEAKVGDRVRVVVKDQAGYRGTDFDKGGTLAELEALVTVYNVQLGVTQAEVMQWTLRSMRECVC